MLSIQRSWHLARHLGMKSVSGRATCAWPVFLGFWMSTSAQDSDGPDLTARERALVFEHLQRRYANVFTNDAIESHVRDYVGFPFADAMVSVVSLHVPV